MSDAINHPKHYTAHPSGIEAIAICEGFDFTIGNAIKYLWRAGLKGDALEDLRKAAWYVQRAIEREERRRAVEPAHVSVPSCGLIADDGARCVLRTWHGEKCRSTP